MSPPPHIRRARAADAEPLAALIADTLRISNMPDYGAENIARVEAHFTPGLIRTYMASWTMFVAEDDMIRGTASHFEGSVRAFFVDPKAQGRGIGRALMDAVFATSAAAGEPQLSLRSSLYAEAFYRRLGFTAGRDLWHGTERTIEMVRPTPLASSRGDV